MTVFLYHVGQTSNMDSREETDSQVQVHNMVEACEGQLFTDNTTIPLEPNSVSDGVMGTLSVIVTESQVPVGMPVTSRAISFGQQMYIIQSDTKQGAGNALAHGFVLSGNTLSATSGATGEAMIMSGSPGENIITRHTMPELEFTGETTAIDDGEDLTVTYQRLQSGAVSESGIVTTGENRKSLIRHQNAFLNEKHETFLAYYPFISLDPKFPF